MNRLSKLIFLFIAIFSLSGCATPGLTVIFKDRGTLNTIFSQHKDWDEKTKDSFLRGELQLEMTKGQVLYLQGSPASWSKYKIGNDTYESWSWEISVAPYSGCDFKNGLLVGYSVRGKYYSIDGVDDVRNYEIKNKYYSDTAKYKECSYCGFKFKADNIECPRCGRKN